MAGVPQLSVALAASPTLTRSLPGGQSEDPATEAVTTGTGLEAVVWAVDVLLFEFRSLVEELIVAVLLMSVLLATPQLTLATRVMVAVASGSSEPTVMVRLLPVPLQDPWLELQETYVVKAG